MRITIPVGLNALLLGSVLVGSGCMPSHAVPLYNLWVVNTGAEDRLIVLGNNPDGASTQPPVLVPADGVTRSTYGSTMGSQPGATAAILVYSLDCTLLEKVDVRVGSYLLTLRPDDVVLTELARSQELTGAELAAAGPRSCPGGAPP